MLVFFPFHFLWDLFVVLSQAGKKSFGDEFSYQASTGQFQSWGVPFLKLISSSPREMQRKPPEFSVTHRNAGWWTLHNWCDTNHNHWKKVNSLSLSTVKYWLHHPWGHLHLTYQQNLNWVWQMVFTKLFFFFFFLQKPNQEKTATSTSICV